MSDPLRIKLVAKPLNSTKYHLATFDHKLHSNSKLPRHILKEVTQEGIDAEIKEVSEREKVSVDKTLMDEKPTLARKIQRMRYTFEEELDDDSGRSGQRQIPLKYKGYLDDNYAATTQPNVAGSNASYAIMIYDVSESAC